MYNSNMPMTKSELQKQWEFVMAMTEREIKSRYKSTLLGLLWVIVKPLLQMGVYGFVFQYFIKVDVSNYFIYLFAGLLIWEFFSDTLIKNTYQFLHKRSLLKKASFPRINLIFSTLLANSFNFLVALSLLLIVQLIRGDFSATKIILFPLALFWLGLPALGFSLLLSALNVRYRDIGFLVNSIMPLWFYWTPVIYSLELLPPAIRWVFYLNPITEPLVFFRSVLLGLPIELSVFSGVSMVANIIILGIGWLVFKQLSGYFDDWI